MTSTAPKTKSQAKHLQVVCLEVIREDREHARRPDNEHDHFPWLSGWYRGVPRPLYDCAPDEIFQRALSRAFPTRKISRDSLGMWVVSGLGTCMPTGQYVTETEIEQIGAADIIGWDKTTESPEGRPGWDNRDRLKIMITWIDEEIDF